jgi:hypothetical protein
MLPLQVERLAPNQEAPESESEGEAVPGPDGGREPGGHVPEPTGGHAPEPEGVAL